MKGIELMNMIHEQKHDLKGIVDLIVVFMDDMEMVKQCNEWLKDSKKYCITQKAHTFIYELME